MSDSPARPDSLLPYAIWTEEALRAVVQDALVHTAKHGLPGEHHFYITFRTDQPGVSIPGHLRARYPQEMTIVLQHKFWDLSVDRGTASFTVGLSFGGVPAMLTVPFRALTAFADPHVRFGLRFQSRPAEETIEPEAPEAAAAAPSQVVSLDSFRRRPARD